MGKTASGESQSFKIQVWISMDIRSITTLQTEQTFRKQKEIDDDLSFKEFKPSKGRWREVYNRVL